MKNIKKLLSLLLCGIMLFGMFPASLFAADGDTGDGSGTISETFVPEITWKRTFEYEHRHDTAENQHTDLGGLYAGDKTAYLSTESKTENSVTTYKNKVHWDWATLSGHFNGRTDDVDDSAHKVWDYGHTDVQYADPVKASITNPIASSSQIGGVGIIPYAPSAGEQAIFAATWNNRAAQAFDASSVDGTDISYSSDYVSVKKGQMDIGYGKKSNDSTISDFSGKSYTARRFSGSFVWPEGYTLVKDNENSVYGYADAYKGFADYSNGGALKATLDLNGGKRAYTTDAVEFSFSGTGFDIISECGTDTGLLLVALSKGGNPFKVYIVDTYFCGDNSIAGNPIITGPGILDYQVPVVRAMNLERADYSVRILGYLTNTAGAIVGPASPTPWDGGETGAEGSTRGANGIDTNRILREAGLKEFIGCEVETSFMDENSVLNGGTGIAAKNSPNRTFGKRGEETAQTADVYLDAFRVYQPLADETKYVENEQGLAYAPVYDYVKNSAELTGSEILPNSMVYVEYDGDTGIANIVNYQKRGPQNEVYLTNGNYIGFVLEGYTGTETVMISAKAVAGDPVLGYLDTDTNAEGAVTPSGMKMTEMYYDVTACVQQYGTKHMLVLGNIAEAGTGTGTRSILSVSGIKLANHINPATSTQIAADIPSLPSAAKSSMRSALKSAAQVMFPTIRSTSAGLPSPIPKRRLQAQAMQGLKKSFISMHTPPKRASSGTAITPPPTRFTGSMQTAQEHL